jgi:hypothetical protein
MFKSDKGYQVSTHVARREQLVPDWGCPGDCFMVSTFAVTEDIQDESCLNKIVARFY